MAAAVRDAVAGLAGGDAAAAAAAAERLLELVVEGHAALLLAAGAVPALVAAAQRPEAPAAAAAAEALQCLGEIEVVHSTPDAAAATDALVAAGVIPLAVRLLGHAEGRVAEAAGTLLCNLAQCSSARRRAARGARKAAMLAAGAVPALISAALRRPTVSGAAAALCNLSYGHPNEVCLARGGVDAIAAVLAAPDKPHARVAASALMKIVESKNQDEDPRLGARREAVSANRGALAALVAATARGGEPEASAAAVKALAWCGMRHWLNASAPAWGAPPAALLADDARMDRLIAAGAHVPLVEALAHPDPEVSSLAACALSYIGADAAAHENPRADAIFAVPGAVAALLAALRRKEAKVVGAAAFAVSNVSSGGDPIGGPARRAALAADGRLALILAVAQHRDGKVAAYLSTGLKNLLSAYPGDGGYAERRDAATGLGAVKILVAAAARRDGGATLIEKARAVATCRLPPAACRLPPSLPAAAARRPCPAAASRLPLSPSPQNRASGRCSCWRTAAMTARRRAAPPSWPKRCRRCSRPPNRGRRSHPSTLFGRCECCWRAATSSRRGWLRPPPQRGGPGQGFGGRPAPPGSRGRGGGGAGAFLLLAAAAWRRRPRAGAHRCRRRRWPCRVPAAQGDPVAGGDPRRALQPRNRVAAGRAVDASGRDRAGAGGGEGAPQRDH